MIKAISFLSTLTASREMGSSSFSWRWDNELNKLDDFERDCKNMSLDVVYYETNGCGTDALKELVQGELFGYLESKTSYVPILMEFPTLQTT